MATQNYLIIENNIVTNLVIWDGDTSIWQPPSGSIVILQATTPAMVWSVPTATIESVLQEVMGVGAIGFTWDGSVLTTNQSQPIYVASTL